MLEPGDWLGDRDPLEVNALNLHFSNDLLNLLLWPDDILVFGLEWSDVMFIALFCLKLRLKPLKYCADEALSLYILTGEFLVWFFLITLYFL